MPKASTFFSLTCPVLCVIKISGRAGLDTIKHLDKRDDSVGLLSSRCFQLDGSAVDWSLFLAFRVREKIILSASPTMCVTL